MVEKYTYTSITLIKLHQIELYLIIILYLIFNNYILYLYYIPTYL